MTNKQAQITINAIKFMLDNAQYSEDVEEALDMAINALSAQPELAQNLHNACADPISRQALMKEFSDFVRASNNSDFARTPTWNDAVSLVGSMPSAQPSSSCAHENDTISRRMAIDAMANTLWHYPNECYRNLNEYEFAKGLAELGLKSVPSVQLDLSSYSDKLWRNAYERGKAEAEAEIIRCKDCKWKQGAECVRFADVRPWPDDFCSRAERREE